MPLNDYRDIYHGRKSQIVSKEKGRKHTGLNPKECYVTHYRVDGVILQNQTACDYILINETERIAFLKKRVFSIVEAIKNAVGEKWDALKERLSSILQSIGETVSAVWNTTKDTMSIFNNISQYISSIWYGIKDAVSFKISAMWEKIKSVFHQHLGHSQKHYRQNQRLLQL